MVPHGSWEPQGTISKMKEVLQDETKKRTRNTKGGDNADVVSGKVQEQLNLT